jgi:hypothetical protein
MDEFEPLADSLKITVSSPTSPVLRRFAYQGATEVLFEPSNYASTIYRARKAITVPKENMFNRARIESGEKCTINFAQGK